MKEKVRNLQRELKKEQKLAQQEVSRMREEMAHQEAQNAQRVVDKATRKMDASKRKKTSKQTKKPSKQTKKDAHKKSDPKAVSKEDDCIELEGDNEEEENEENGPNPADIIRNIFTHSALRGKPIVKVNFEDGSKSDWLQLHTIWYDSPEVVKHYRNRVWPTNACKRRIPKGFEDPTEEAAKKMVMISGMDGEIEDCEKARFSVLYDNGLGSPNSKTYSDLQAEVPKILRIIWLNWSGRGIMKKRND